MKKLPVLGILLMLVCCVKNPGEVPPGSAEQTAGADLSQTETLPPDNPDLPEPPSGGPVIDTLHFIRYSGISGLEPHMKKAFAATISSIQGLMNRFEGNDAIFIKMSNELDWSQDLAVYANALKSWGNDYRGMIAATLPKAGTKYYVLMKDFGTTEDDDLMLTVATSYASAHGAFILTESQENDPLFEGYTCVADTRDKTMQDVYEMLRDGYFNTDGVVSVNRSPNHNVDLSIYHQWASIRSSDEEFTDRFFSLIDPVSIRISYNGPTTYEGLNVRASTRRDLYVVAAGLCCNMSTHERIPPPSTDLSVNTRSFPTDYERKDVHRVMILVSDGGNLDYFEGKFTNCYKSPHYGEFPVNFQMTPSLKRFKPIVHDWYMRHMAPNSCVVASLSGAGDIFPSLMTGDEAREKYGRLTSELLNKEGQSMTVIMDRNDIINNDWNKVLRYSAPVVRQIEGCRGVIFMGFAFWMDGAGGFIGDVPMVASRFGCGARDGEIMDLPENPKSQRNVAEQVKRLPKDAEDPDGYSVIIFSANPPGDVEPKGDIMEDMAVLVRYLQEDPGIEIVNARQFFDLYTYHLKNSDKVPHI